jgi:hypothetical protein
MPAAHEHDDALPADVACCPAGEAVSCALDIGLHCAAYREPVVRRALRSRDGLAVRVHLLRQTQAFLRRLALKATCSR